MCNTKRVPTWSFEAIPVPRLVVDETEEPLTLSDGKVLRSWIPHPDDWDAWKQYCKKRNWYPLFSTRLAWCDEHSTYLRGSSWIATHEFTGLSDLVTDDEKLELEKEMRLCE